MIEIYSSNVTAGADSTIPLKNVSIRKGCSALKDGDTISLEKCGVYKVACDGCVTIPTGGTETIQLRKNGVLQPQALATITGVADNVVPFAFTTLVQVPFNNTPCPCTSGTTIDFINSIETNYPQFNVVVTQLA